MGRSCHWSLRSTRRHVSRRQVRPRRCFESRPILKPRHCCRQCRRRTRATNRPATGYFWPAIRRAPVRRRPAADSAPAVPLRSTDAALRSLCCGRYHMVAWQRVTWRIRIIDQWFDISRYLSATTSPKTNSENAQITVPHLHEDIISGRVRKRRIQIRTPHCCRAPRVTRRAALALRPGSNLPKV